jgi:hypothetical protein
MKNRYLAPVAVLLVSLSLVSCGLIGSDDSGLKIEYEAHHLSYADRWDWQPGKDSMLVDVSVDGEQVAEEVGGPTISGSFEVSRDRGETAYITARIPSRGREDGWNATLEVSWGNQRESDQGYRGYSSFDPPSVSVPLNE